MKKIKTYFFNCFLLVIPVLAWDLLLADNLPGAFQPEIFWKNIPGWLAYGENISRTLIFLFTLLMPLRIVTIVQFKGLILYLAGLQLYFASWLAIIYFPDGAWSENIAGFTAPAYTALLWLAGIGLMGDSFYFKLPYRRWVFMLLSLIFLVFHMIHTCIIYNRVHSI